MQIGFYPVSKIASKWNPDLTQTGIGKCLNDITIFESENCISDMFKNFQLFKGEPRYIVKNGKKSVVGI